MHQNEYIPSKKPCWQNKQMTLYKILYKLRVPRQAKTTNCLNIVTALQPEDQFPKSLPCRQYSPIHGSLNIKMKTKTIMLTLLGKAHKNRFSLGNDMSQKNSKRIHSKTSECYSYVFCDPLKCTYIQKINQVT